MVQVPANVNRLSDPEAQQSTLRVWEELSRADARLTVCETDLAAANDKIADLETQILELRQVRDLTQRP